MCIRNDRHRTRELTAEVLRLNPTPMIRPIHMAVLSRQFRPMRNAVTARYRGISQIPLVVRFHQWKLSGLAGRHDRRLIFGIRDHRDSPGWP
jgi:hypothetical protein